MTSFAERFQPPSLSCDSWDLTMSGRVTWDQALFSFCFENYIPAGKTKRKESLIQTFNEMSAAHFFDWLTFAESANQNYFRCLFSSMQIFHAWEKCRLADLKNSFYLLIKMHLVSGQQLAEGLNSAIHSLSVNKANPEKIWTTTWIFWISMAHIKAYFPTIRP